MVSNWVAGSNLKARMTVVAVKIETFLSNIGIRYLPSVLVILVQVFDNIKIYCRFKRVHAVAKTHLELETRNIVLIIHKHMLKISDLESAT